MKLRECTDGVYRIKSGDDVKDLFLPADYAANEVEIEAVLIRLNKIGVEVYIAEGKNFPKNHRGTYYTDKNSFFLNLDYVKDIAVFMKVLRHEGWHAAQDCMAGSIDNSHIAVIHLPETVPQRWQVDADIRYGLFSPNAIPWEAEAIWAGNTQMMTADALGACVAGEMWREYDPTPKTKEWLTNNGYIKE